ncbi:MAG TPA: hypothetical protein VLH79_09225, partial [Chthonomonadales bacterium]|nr:hypothetical protein [Chthonomonadales bacterium]
MPSSKPARPGRLWLRILRYVLIAVVVGVVLFGFQAARLYTDWLWFRELQQPGVFSTIVLSRVMLF